MTRRMFLTPVNSDGEEDASGTWFRVSYRKRKISNYRMLHMSTPTLKIVYEQTVAGTPVSKYAAVGCAEYMKQLDCDTVKLIEELCHCMCDDLADDVHGELASLKPYEDMCSTILRTYHQQEGHTSEHWASCPICYGVSD